MITLEEAKKIVDWSEIAFVGQRGIENLVDNIYSSIGSCGECIYYENGQCSATKDMVYRNPLFFCADFKRKET